MAALTLDQASIIVDKALEKGRELKLQPLTVIVLVELMASVVAALPGHRVSQPRFGRADQDPAALLAAQHLVVGGGPDPVQVDRVQGQVAAFAPAAAQRGRAHAVLGPHPLVQGQ